MVWVDYLQHGCYNSSLGHMTFLDQQKEAEMVACEPVLRSLAASILTVLEASHQLRLASWRHVTQSGVTTHLQRRQ